MKKLKEKNNQKGFSIFLAIIITGVLLIVAFSVTHLSSKELSFSGINRDSQHAIFAADAGAECALYWDAKVTPTKFDPLVNGSPITCNGLALSTGNSIAGTTTLTNIGGSVSSGGGNTASFSGSDSSTRGSWIGVYGEEAHNIANSSQSFPPGISESANSPALTHTWQEPSSDVRATQIPPDGTSRIASTWYSNPNSFDIDVNITDGVSHKISLYLLDWDPDGRVETIDVLDGDTLDPLDSQQTISNFANGIYYSWNISGHVKFRITKIAGANPVVAAIFFDPADGVAGTSVFGFSMDSGNDPNQPCAIVTVEKDGSGGTHIFSRGYNTCDINSPRRVERGIEVKY